MSITMSEREGLQCCPCVGCDAVEKECDPLGYCVDHAAWLEGRKKAAMQSIDRLDRISRSYIRAVKTK
jgi:hypothetical protein